MIAFGLDVIATEVPLTRRTINQIRIEVRPDHIRQINKRDRLRGLGSNTSTRLLTTFLVVLLVQERIQNPSFFLVFFCTLTTDGEEGEEGAERYSGAVRVSQRGIVRNGVEPHTRRCNLFRL